MFVANSASVGLLILRVGASATLLLAHGWGKVVNFGARSQTFADPIGVGSLASLSLVVFAEVVCTTLVAFGFLTRLAAIPIVVFTLVAVFIQHADDPFRQKELAVLLGLVYTTLALTGAGKYSVDAWLARKRGGKRG